MYIVSIGVKLDEYQTPVGFSSGFYVTLESKAISFITLHFLSLIYKGYKGECLREKVVV